MSQTATAPQRSTGLPTDEPIMVRYSPHHEFSLSTVTSVGLHALVIALLVIGGLVIAKLNWGGDQQPLPIDTLTMEPGGGGNPAGADKAPGGGSEDWEPPLPSPDRSDEISRSREKLEARAAAKELPEFRNDEEMRRLIDIGGKEVDKLRHLTAGARRKLDGLAGNGPGPGTGPGGPGGPGKGQAERIRRRLRWTLVFNTRDGNDYRRQLKAFGAILAIPDPNNPDDFLVIRDLDRPTPRAEDVAQIKRFYWIDDGAVSVRSLSSSLGIAPPTYFAVFFPDELEEKLLRLELSYRGKKESEISETRFDVRRRGDSYEPEPASGYPGPARRRRPQTSLKHADGDARADQAGRPRRHRPGWPAQRPPGRHAGMARSRRR